MHWMRAFDYLAPTTIDDAVHALAGRVDARVLAGGTDLLVQLKNGRRELSLAVDVKRIPEVMSLRMGEDGLHVGAAVPCIRIAADAEVRRHFPSLAALAGIIGGTAIQGRASIGGNLCNASPSADSIPLLIALSARVRIAGPNGLREVPAEDFCIAPGKNILTPSEFVVDLFLPRPADGFQAHYLRFIPRNEMDIAVAGAGVSATLENGIITTARIALAAVAPVPLFVREAGDSLIGHPPSLENIQNAAALAQAAAKPISDMRAPADYRRHLCGVLTRRALTTILLNGSGAHA
jgi:carbon-monoxide dehydrogenase medium subunit